MAQKVQGQHMNSWNYSVDERRGARSPVRAFSNSTSAAIVVVTTMRIANTVGDANRNSIFLCSLCNNMSFTNKNQVFYRHVWQMPAFKRYRSFENTKNLGGAVQLPLRVLHKMGHASQNWIDGKTDTGEWGRQTDKKTDGHQTKRTDLGSSWSKTIN